MFLDLPEENEDDQACQECGEADNEDILMYCDCCSKLWHTYCADLDSVPLGSWFCSRCSSDLNSAPPQQYNRHRHNIAGRRRTRRLERNRIRAIATQDDGWNQVWQQVWTRLSFDLDFPDDEESSATVMRRHRQAVEDDRRQNAAFETRARIAEMQGAGSRFRAARQALISDNRGLRPQPAPESAEEVEAWDAFAEATEEAINNETSNNTSQRRKRKSTASPVPQHGSPGSPREAKRRRTSTPPILPRPQRRPRAMLRSSPRPSNTLRTVPRNVVESSGPSFLQSLLQEVEDSAGPGNQPLMIRTSRNPGSPPAEHASPRPSSPATSNHSSPRALSATPPPLMNGFRPTSPPGLSSTIQPVYPSQLVYSPGHSPMSDAKSKNQEAIHPSVTTLPHQIASNTNSIARPTPRRPQVSLGSSQIPLQSHELSSMKPTLSATHKADVQKLVSAALKPHYHDQKISKDEYTVINRDVSRMLYDKIGDFETLDLEGKAKWAEVAGEEVNKAVTALRI